MLSPFLLFKTNPSAIRFLHCVPALRWCGLCAVALAHSSGSTADLMAQAPSTYPSNASVASPHYSDSTFPSPTGSSAQQTTQSGRYLVSFAALPAPQNEHLPELSNRAIAPPQTRVEEIETRSSRHHDEMIPIAPDVDRPTDRPDATIAGEADKRWDKELQPTSPARALLGAWPKKSIHEVRVNANESGAPTPEDRSANLFVSSQRNHVDLGATKKVFAWAAPNIRYQPLFFEDVSLERYGQTKGLVKQPFVSAAKALTDGLLMPYRAYRKSPYSCDSPLGFCRPGSPSDSPCK